MSRLSGVARDLAAGRARALAVEGGSGMGKSALLAAFAREAERDPLLAGRCRVVSVRCHPDGGPDTSFLLALEALLALRPAAETESFWRRVGAAAFRSVPELLGLVVPGLQQLVAVGREVTEAAMRTGSLPGDSLQPQQAAMATQVAEALRAEAASGRPVVLLVDDIQYVDLTSLQVLDLLVAAMPGQPLSLVLGHRTRDGLAGDNAEAVAEVLQGWESTGRLQREQLSGLPADAVDELVRLRVPGAGSTTLSARLSEATGGHPIFVEQLLRLLRAGGAEGSVALPTELPIAISRRFHRLAEPVRDLLLSGAALGQSFLSRAVAEATGVPHDEAVELLRRTARDHGLVRERADRPEWVSWLASDLYEFEHAALREGIYGELTAAQRERRHAELARVLTTLAPQAGPGEPPWALRLDIAAQLKRGGPACRADSAAAHLGLARDAALNGLFFTDAERHCSEAIEAARRLPPDGGDRDRRLAEATELLLSLTEVRWRGQGARAGLSDIDALAAQAEEAARRLADPRLLARTALQRGKTLMATQGLEPSLAKLREAVALAERSADPVALFVATVEYGRQLPKSDLRAGIEVLFRAEEMYAAEPDLGRTDDPVLQHARNLNEMQLGVNLFDLGRFGEAYGRLTRCAARLRSEPLRAELPIALNYLAQLHIAMGEDGEAEAVLVEAREFEEKRGGDSGWHAYNTALLATVLTRRGAGREAARELAEAGWLETERTWLANLVPIVRNLYAEVVLETAAGPGDLEQAERLALATCAETERSGMTRSTIAAHVLRSRVLLLRGAVDEAAAVARVALAILDREGDKPALRTEEVLWYAAEAIGAAGEDAEAGALLERARAEVRRKAASIDDPERRRRFLAEVPLNRWILEGTDGD
ncbi:ATP-binding protein [Streptomyces sp. 8K308]|uniref:AAA family ATPase n=1 Tax=Streptomyces sp. 8K308 TaxID=2530388 RepID=UPI001FB7F322